MSNHTPGPEIWKTQEWGRVWIGCAHGVPRTDFKPIRICDVCFNEVLRKCEDQAVALATKGES